MLRRTLGNSGTTVGVLALGTMTFGAETDEEEAHGQLDDFLAAGGDLIDTADVYTRGASEEIVGRWLASRRCRDDVVLATKARFPMGEGPNQVGLSRRWLVRACEASLRRLGVDHVDLYQTHAWDPATPVEETLAALDDLVAAGKVRHVGVSNVTGWQLQRQLLMATDRARPVTLQPQYNLLSREIEWELVPLCEDTGVGLLPWSPLGGGWLTGKYRRDERPPGRPVSARTRSGASRPGTSGRPTRPGASSTRSRRSPTPEASARRRSRSTGSSRSPPCRR